MTSSNEDSASNTNIILSSSLLIDYLLPNWFHTIRQPLTIISTASGFLQILSGTDSFSETVFSDKLQMVQNNSRQIEQLLNDLKFFLAGNQTSIEKISLSIRKIFDLMGRDISCWNISSDITTSQDFHTQNSVSISLIIAAIYKAFGSSSNRLKTASLAICNASEIQLPATDLHLTLAQLFIGSNENQLTIAVETLLSYSQDIRLDLHIAEDHLSIFISETNKL